MSKTHGLSIVNGQRTRLNYIWKQMRQRCSNPKSHAYERYGGKGITVCREWDDFKCFHDWALSNGYNDNLEIDRKENSRGYGPDNCQWSTLTQQARNRSNNRLLTFNGETKSMAEWCETSKIGYRTISSRLNTLKWSIEKALTQPRRKLCRRKSL
jgi:hypothetical protein